MKLKLKPVSPFDYRSLAIASFAIFALNYLLVCKTSFDPTIDVAKRHHILVGIFDIISTLYHIWIFEI